MTTISKSAFFLTVSGECLSASDADRLVEKINFGELFVIDFDALGDISFEALRKLYYARGDGKNFMIINADDKIACKMEDAGITFIINVCRKPSEISLEGCEEFGGGYMSKAYNSADGDAILKVYDREKIPLWQVVKEKMTSRSVMKFGLPTPFAGGIYTNKGNWVITFERIKGKRSLSRIISQEPSRLEEICTDFALMCRDLHSKECDTGIFPSRKDLYRSSVISSNLFNEAQKSAVISFIDSVPDATTCLHGDMQLSNVIDVNGKRMWIDLADFSYGYPILDLGMWYFLANLTDDAHCDNVFHMNSDSLKRCWKVFAPVYFDTQDPEILKNKEAQVEKFAALHMCYLGCVYYLEPWMMGYITEKLFRG